MKRLSLFLLCALFSFACNKSDNDLNGTPEIIIAPDTNIWVESEGGTQEVAYTINNKQSGVSLKAETETDWITDIVIGNSITFSVEENATKEERRGTIKLSYGNASALLIIKQHSYIDVFVNATTTSGSLYYGGEGVYCYTVVLSTAGFSNGLLQPNSEYYYFDLYSSTPASGNVATIPQGTYRQTSNTLFRDGDMDPKYCNLTITDDANFIETPFSKATVVVTDNHIEAEVTFADGECHSITYNGSLEIPFYSSVSGGDNGGGNTGSGLSTLTADHYFNIDGGVFIGAYVGDLMSNGCNTCQVYLFEYLDYETGEERGDQFQIDLQLPLGTIDICGTYTHGTTAGHFIPGWAEDYGDGQYLQQNSWYMTAGFVNFAPLIEGSVIVEKDDSEIYTFTIDTIDDKGNNVKGVFKGQGKLTEW